MQHLVVKSGLVVGKVLLVPVVLSQHDELGVVLRVLGTNVLNGPI